MNKKILLILFIVTSPLFIATYLININYKGNTQQKGILLPKAFKINDTLSSPITKHKWHLLYIQLNEKSDVKNILKNFNQILNIHQTEKARLIITIISTKKQNEKIKQTTDIKAEFINTSAKKIQTILQKINRTSNTIAIIDPKGYLQLIYPTNKWPINLNHDLKKLMKISQSG